MLYGIEYVTLNVDLPGLLRDTDITEEGEFKYLDAYWISALPSPSEFEQEYLERIDRS